MTVRGAAVFRPPIGEHPVRWDLVLLEEGQHPIIEEFSRVTGVFRSYNLAKPILLYVSMKVCW